MKGIIFVFVLIWTTLAVILSLCGVGAFAEWPITAMPWHWSCLCILYWDLISSCALIFLVILIHAMAEWRKEKIINSYAPEQREFIRRLMDK